MSEQARPVPTDDRIRLATEDDLDIVRRQRNDLENRLIAAYERVDQLHQLVTTTESARDRYRDLLDRANINRQVLQGDLADQAHTIADQMNENDDLRQQLAEARDASPRRAHDDVLARIVYWLRTFALIEDVEEMLERHYADWPEGAVTSPHHPIAGELLTNLASRIERREVPQMAGLDVQDAEDRRRHALVLNAITRILSESRTFAPLSVRAGCATAALEALAERPRRTIQLQPHVQESNRLAAELERLRIGLLDRCIQPEPTDPVDTAIVDTTLRALDLFLVVVDAATQWRTGWADDAGKALSPGTIRDLIVAVDKLLAAWPGIDLSIPAVSIAEVAAESTMPADQPTTHPRSS